MKKYRFTKLDKRYNGHQKFKYSISPTAVPYLEQQQDFQELREWMWENYGPSMELEWAMAQARANQTEAIWAWDTEHKNKRLYLRGDAELTFLKLKFT